MSDSIFYNELNPPEDLKDFVECFWEFLIPSDSQMETHSIFPDGALNIACCKNQNFQWIKILGPRLTPLVVPVFPETQYWGVRFVAHAGSSLLGLSSVHLYEKLEKLSDFSPGFAKELSLLLQSSLSSTEVVEGFWRLLRWQKLNRPAQIDLQVMRAVQLIMEKGGKIRIDQISEQIGIGLCQLQRKFKLQTSLSLNEFIRIHRIRASMVSMVAQDRRQQPESDFRFTDHSHIIKETNKVRAKTPLTLLTSVQDIK